MFESITLIKAKMILFSAKFLHNVPLGAPEVDEDESMAENSVELILRLCFPLTPFFFPFPLMNPWFCDLVSAVDPPSPTRGSI